MQKRRFVWIAVIVLGIVGIGAVGVSLGAQEPVPVRLLTHYPLEMLMEEAQTMNDCVECHEPEKFHTCSTCHDDHGAIELTEVPFYAVIAFAGDVPEPGYVLVDDILPYREQPNTYITLVDFLASQGVTEFESVTLASVDEGFVTISRENLTDEAWLLPYEDGIRFAAENLHISTWIKGIRRMIVVTEETPLVIDGQATSMGRLLLGPTLELTVEQTDVMLKSETDAQIRKAQTAARIQGAPVDAWVMQPDFTQLVIRDGEGAEHTLSAEEAQGAVLSQIQGQATLVLPQRGRSQWIADVVEIESK